MERQNTLTHNRTLLKANRSQFLVCMNIIIKNLLQIVRHLGRLWVGGADILRMLRTVFSNLTRCQNHRRALDSFPEAAGTNNRKPGGETSERYALTVLEARHVRSRCQRAWFLLGVLRASLLLLSPASVRPMLLPSQDLFSECPFSPYQDTCP